MVTDEAKMWDVYRYKGFQVQVIQKWKDPFGKSMVRVAAIDDPDKAMGLAEAEFIAEAEPLPEQPAGE